MVPRLRLENFRGIRALDWSPEGFSLLAGPNSSGKTTVLRGIAFLRTAWLRGVSEAVRLTGGARWLRHLGVEDEPVDFEMTWGDVTWRISVPIEGDGFHPFYGERLEYRGETILSIPQYQASYSFGGTVRQRGELPESRTLETLERWEWLVAFGEQVKSMRVYWNFNTEVLSRPKLGEETYQYLRPDGRNLAFVLRNWRSAPRESRGQFEWVLDTIRRGFPEVIQDLEFQADGSAFFYPGVSESAEDRLPLHLAADGLLVALAQLTAIAGAKDGSLVAIDELENHLHPHAIRTIVRAMRTLAEERQLTVVITTHSPVVMNHFRGEPWQFYVMKPNAGRLPCPLNEMHDEDWLEQFRLGDLYEGSLIAGPNLPEAE